VGRKLRRAGLVTKSLFYAVLVHVAVGALLLFNFEWPTRVESSPAADPAPVQANVVSEAEIQRQMEAIRREEEAEKRRQQEAQEKLDELLKAQQEEQEQLEEIKRRREEEARQAERLAEKKEQERREVAELERKKEEQRKKAEAERQRAAEAERRRREAEAERQRQAEAERKRKEEEERQRQAEAERQRKEEQERKRQEEAERRRREEQREEELAAERERELQEQLERERLQRQVDSALARFIPIIKQKVNRNWNRPPGLSSRIEAHVSVRLSRSGEVLSARIVRSSGNQVFDRSVENAVRKASPLPIPQERGVNEEFRNIKLIFKPEEMIS